MLTAPFKWKGRDWLKAGIISGSALGLYAADNDIQRWVQRNRESTSNTISDIFEPLGNSDNLLPWSPVILMYVFGSITDNYRTKKTALLAAESFVISTIYTRILKVTIRRRRPLSNSKKSFPSGHTSSIFAVATVLALEYKETRWIPTILYTASALSSLSRINDMEHWSSDVFVGFLIGFYTGRTVFNQHNSGKESNLSFLPLFLPDGFGMKINWKLNK
jgi:membrane-associated phospholipid phosphatase